MEKENKKTKILKIENKNLKNENEVLRRHIDFLIKSNNDIGKENKELDLENAKLKLFEINTKSYIRSYLLVLNDYKKYYEKFGTELMVADLEKIINFMEGLIK